MHEAPACAGASVGYYFFFLAFFFAFFAFFAMSTSVARPGESQLYSSQWNHLRASSRIHRINQPRLR